MVADLRAGTNGRGRGRPRDREAIRRGAPGVAAGASKRAFRVPRQARCGRPSRPGGVDPSRSTRPRGSAAQRYHDVSGSRRHGDRALPAGAQGGAVRPRRSCGLPVVGRDERRPGAGGSASTRLRWPRRRSASSAGLPHPSILATCALLGVDEVYAAGGAQAIAMFAYGAEPSAPVDLVTGPGNVYVTAAKRLVRSIVGIDSEAGPTEIAILADETADPVLVAADLISCRARRRRCGCPRHCERGAGRSGHHEPPCKSRRRSTATAFGEALTGPQSAVVLVDDLERGVQVVNAYAAEHVEIHTDDARSIALRIRNAGAIFVGSWSPVSLGDYCAGSNHVLPTGGYACHSSGLSVQTFLRGIHIIDYDERALRDVGQHVVTLANAEDLPAHGQAVEAVPFMTSLDRLPLRDDLRGSPCTARHSWTCRCGSTPTRIRTPVGGCRRRHRPCCGRKRLVAQPVSGSSSVLRADLAGYLGHGLAAQSVWAANGWSRCRSCCRRSWTGSACARLRAVVHHASTHRARHLHRLGHCAARSGRLSPST